MHYILKITLQDWTPTNRRRISIPVSCTFKILAQTIWDLYNLHGEHLREFTKNETICINHPEIRVDELSTLDLSDPEVVSLMGKTTQVSSSYYTLDQYFSVEEMIDFIYDFGASRTFTVKKEALTSWWSPDAITVLDGQWVYLVEDSGGPRGLKEYLEDYKKHKFDEDRREDRQEFEERLQPALTRFEKKAN